jgi:hypothetical protein
MKTTLCLVVLLVAIVIPCDVSSQYHHGRAARLANMPDPMAGVDSPSVPQRKVDRVKLSAQADELSRLAQSIPPDVEQVSRGMLPKDTAEKLKRIEKLSKQLRSELNP